MRKQAAEEASRPVEPDEKALRAPSLQTPSTSALLQQQALVPPRTFPPPAPTRLLLCTPPLWREAEGVGDESGKRVLHLRLTCIQHRDTRHAIVIVSLSVPATMPEPSRDVEVSMTVTMTMTVTVSDSVTVRKSDCVHAVALSLRCGRPLPLPLLRVLALRPPERGV